MPGLRNTSDASGYRERSVVHDRQQRHSRVRFDHSTKLLVSRLCLLFILLVSGGCRETILHDMSEFEANRVVTHLNGLRVDARKEKQPDGRWSVAVPEAESIRALKLLDEGRLMRAHSNPPERAGITATREEHRFRLERGLSRELELTLASIEGVLEARVHLNLPPTDPLFGTPVKGAVSSASVLLLAAPGSAVTRESIAALVGGASGIDVQRISVLVSAPIDETSWSAPQDTSTVVVASDEDLVSQQFLIHIGAWTLVAAAVTVLVLYRPRRAPSSRFSRHAISEAV